MQQNRERKHKHQNHNNQRQLFSTCVSANTILTNNNISIHSCISAIATVTTTNNKKHLQ